MQLLTEYRCLPLSLALLDGTNGEKHSPPIAVNVLDEIRMTNILYIILDGIVTQWVIRSCLPWPERAFVASANPFTMSALGTTLGSEKIIVIAPLEDV